MNFKTICVILISIGILFGIFVCAWAEEYPKSFIINEVDYENHILYLHDFNGEEWIYEETDDWTPGDFVAAIMDDNGTLEIYDDIIIMLRYQC